MFFFHSWYTPKEHVFRDPNTFSNLHEALSSVSHFVLIQRWTALIQRKPALNSSETALISAEIFEISETALFSADLLWDFNPGTLSDNLVHVFYPFDQLVEDVRNWRLLLLMLNDSGEIYIGEFLQRLWRFEVCCYFSKIWVVIYWPNFTKKRL